jgi:ABC-type lipoprotein release transport system permease subunit
MDNQQEWIETVKPDGKKGSRIQKDLYFRIVGLIVAAMRETDEISLANTLTLIKEACSTQPNIEFISLQVKLDLEAKGYLKIVRTRDTYQQIISLSRRGKVHFNVNIRRSINHRSK